MGTVGDQSINFNQNKTLALSKQSGIKVYLFESYKDNEYYYDGEVELYGSIFQSKEIDANGNLRTVIKFPLKRVDASKEIIIDYSDVETSINEKSKSLKNLSSDEIKAKAKSIDYSSVSKEVKTTYRERNQYIYLNILKKEPKEFVIYVEKKLHLKIKMVNHIWNLPMLLLLLKVAQMQSIIR